MRRICGHCYILWFSLFRLILSALGVRSDHHCPALFDVYDRDHRDGLSFDEFKGIFIPTFDTEFPGIIMSKFVITTISWIETQYGSKIFSPGTLSISVYRNIRSVCWKCIVRSVVV